MEALSIRCPQPVYVMMTEDKGEVLVVDDERSVADALKLILEDEGFVVTVALSGREAIEKARQKKFRLVITDLRLPDLNGFDVLRAFSAEHPGSTGILITSYGTPEIEAEARACGASTVLPKPFLPSDIVRLVTAALA